MLTEEKIKRINELVKISKTRDLTDQEKEEQDKLRKEYIEAFRENFKKQLENIRFVDNE